MKIKKFIRLQKQSDIIDDPKKLSLGSLYFVGSSIGMYDGSDVIAMPISLKRNTVSLYFITAYGYHILKSSKSGVVIFPFGTHKLFAKIVRIFNIKINEKIVNIIFNAFAEKNTSAKSTIVAKIKRSNIEFIDDVVTFSNNQIPSLKLHLIKRITNINEWPRIAIKKWAMHHLELENDSMKYIYGSSLQYNKKSLINALQKQHTYSASKNMRRKGSINRPKVVTTVTEVDGSIITINAADENYHGEYNEGCCREDDNIPF